MANPLDDRMGEALPKETHRGEITVLGVTVIVSQLDNGERVFEAESFKRLLHAMFDEQRDMDEKDGREIVKLMHAPLPELEPPSK